MSQFHSSPNGNDPQTATIGGQSVGVGEGLIEKTGWFESLKINLREK